jgi:large subunit ribosomal protein L17
MRHGKSRYKLNRNKSWRDATVKSMVRNILLYQSIRTSLTRAKAAQPLVDKLITLGKANTLAGRRQAFDVLGDHKLVSALFKDIGPRFTKRNGGYTRIINIGNRRGDNASLVIWELTEIKEKEARKPKKSKEAKPEETTGQVIEPSAAESSKHETQAAVKEHPPASQKPSKKFLGGIKNIFKKERDSL